MTIVLQIIDVLYIKYKSPESIVLYISNHWMETMRERVCQYYWKNVGDVLYVHSERQTPKRYTVAPESSNRKSDHKIYSKGSKGRSSKKNKK